MAQANQKQKGGQKGLIVSYILRKSRAFCTTTFYLTGALWPVSSKAIHFAKSAIFSAHSSCRAKRGGVHLDVLCPCLRCAVRHCQIQNYLVQVQLAERQVALLGLIGFLC